MAQSVWLKPCIDYYLCFACIDEQRYYVQVVPKSEVKVIKPRVYRTTFEAYDWSIRNQDGCEVFRDADRHVLMMMAPI